MRGEKLLTGGIWARMAVISCVLAGFVFANGAQAASANWKVLGFTGPTHLPPVANEIQMLKIDATGGTFALTFEAQTTSSLPADAAPGAIASALNELTAIGGVGGVVQVEGGPGDAEGTTPYYVQFEKALAAVDVSEIVIDDSSLTGAGATGSVDTKVNGGEEGSGTIGVIPTNVGSVASSGILTLTVGPLPAGITTSGPAIVGATQGWTCPGGAGESIVTCSRTNSTPAAMNAGAVYVPVSIGPAAPATSTVSIEVSEAGTGGDSHQLPIAVSANHAPAGIQSIWAGAFDSDGKPSTVAGGHPALAATGFMLNTRLSPGGQVIPSGDIRDVIADLPPGLAGNPQVTARCPQSEVIPRFGGTLCGTSAVVGESVVYPELFEQIPNTVQNERVYNAKPAEGFAAQFSFPFRGAITSVLASVRSDEDYGVTVKAANAAQFIKVWGSFFFLHGVPDAAGDKAFLSNPTNCAEQRSVVPVTEIGSNTWQVPSLFDSHVIPQPAVVGCENLKFGPGFSFQPSAQAGATGVASTAHLHVDQAALEDPDALVSPHLKESVVMLPEGLTLNPSAADGLEACSTAQIGYRGDGFPMPNPMRFDEAPVQCPDASKIGTAEVKTPLLEKPLNGTVYLAAQNDNPFKSLIAMYIVVEDEETGITVKLPGEVVPDSQTGQMTAYFDNNPQVPFEDLTLKFRGGGPRSTLATPDVCGTYSTRGEFTPWSAPESGPPAQTTNSFTISGGPNGAPCANSKAERPFNLGFDAGTTNAKGGEHSPFTLRITRPDGNQELDKITLNTPPGLLATLKGVGMCSEASLSAAQDSNRTGKEEMANPSCPGSSQVGTTTIGAGVGSSPLYVKTGKVYLTGPYRGAPLGLAFVVPAVAGPFDLGVQVVRTALRVNPKTAQVTAESDAIPKLLKGIPLLIRDVRVDLDRPGFILNPTNCSEMAISGQVTGGSGAVVKVHNRFRVAGCEKLGFKPILKLRLKGGTKRDRYQQLTATLRARPGDANIARAAVTFPPSIFLAQEHIRTVCTRVQFAADACPKGSIYGYAEAITPLLDDPVKGPVYLRSSDNLLPDLVAALQGPAHQPIEVELAGRNDSKNRGLRNTFDFVPDAPVSKFTLRMRGGKKSLMVSSQNLCRKKQRATVRFNGQNGKKRNFRPKIQIVNCKKGKAPKRKGSKGKRR